MSLDESILNLLGKPYQQAGTGNPGFDCFSICLKGFELLTSINFPEYVWEDYWGISDRDKVTVLNWLDTVGFKTVWASRFTELTKLPNQPLDLLLLRGLGTPFSPMLYLGKFMALQCTNTTGVHLVDLRGFTGLTTLVRIVRYG